ncbi:hypothetical protein C8J57DRAFT_1724869 [Mycena rebaudengoi]|nr:hypothetical protein C8J57DRAFT_1724869 [Mycena rebaudengoi]
MVLKMLAAAAPYFPSEYTVHIVTAVVVAVAARAIAQGRSTTRERDLHARTIIVTGALTPLGLTLVEALASRGAHIIALTPSAVDSDAVTTWIDLLRSTTSNENIYAEQCDLAAPPSIQAFCKRFLEGKEPRVDALLFTHEYRHVGAWGFFRGRVAKEEDEKEREQGALATFLLTTLLLPALLTAPVERDIRIVNVVNRFYAAAASSPALFSSFPSFSPPNPKNNAPKSTLPPTSLFLREGARALRTTVITRHLQRILDSLPTAPVPHTASASSSLNAIPVVPRNSQKSNIVAVSVSPGISRVDTVAPLLNADWVSSGASIMGILFYILLYPLLLILTKSSAAAAQSVLHVLFLPTPFKVLGGAADAQGDSGRTKGGQELLKPGALYAECAVVRVAVPTEGWDALIPQGDNKGKGESKKGSKRGNKKRGGGDKKKADEKKVVGELEDDGELGGERAGRVVWEAYEGALKRWEGGYVAPAAGAAGDAADGDGDAAEGAWDAAVAAAASPIPPIEAIWKPRDEVTEEGEDENENGSEAEEEEPVEPGDELEQWVRGGGAEEGDDEWGSEWLDYAH